MHQKQIKHIIPLLLSLLVIASCGVTKDYSRPEVAVDNLYRDGQGSDTNSIASLHWRELFRDTVLQSLIQEGIDNSLDLQMAYTRVQQAEAWYAQSRAAFFPTLNANTQVTESKLSEVQGFGIRKHATQYQFGLSSGWELNLWGKLSSARRANLADLLQTQAYARAVQTGLVANIANYYYALVAMDKQLAITQQTVAYWDTTVVTMEALKEAAVVTGAAVVQSEASLYAAAVTIPDLKQRIREAENALSVLLGRQPGSIARATIEAQQPFGNIETGVPAMLLSNRPDVQQAELNFRRTFEQTNVARTFFYPNFTITANAGLSSLALNTFLDPASIFASITGGLAQPILNQRQNRTRLEVAKAQQQEALLGFQRSLLTAGQEVSDALSLYHTAEEKISVRSKQLEALGKSVEYSMALLHYGSANYTEVITARQSMLIAELNQVSDKLQQLQAITGLYRALGGGWQ